MNSPDYVVRPKITVVKSKMRGTAPEETRIDRNESNYFPSRSVFAIPTTSVVVMFEFINTYYGSNDSVTVLQKMNLFFYVLQFK